MRPADKAWLVLAAGIIAYDLFAPEGETLSEAADRYLLAKPWLTRLAIFTVAHHLANELNPDPLHMAFVLVRRLRRRSP